MDTPTPPEDELDGLWLFDGQRERLDDALVKTRFRSPDDQSAPVHGTYTRFCYHYVALRSGSPQSERPRRDPLGKPTPQPEVERISNYILEIFDEEGNFGHSEWNGDVRWGKGDDEIGAWKFSYASISLTVPPKTSPYLPEGDTLALQPSLSLEPFSANDARFPRNGADKKTPVPLPVSPGSPPPSQYVYYDPDQAQLVWVRPDLRLSLRFTKPKAALRGKAQELGVDPWSNTFVHSVPQWSLPLAGWDPSELDDPVYGRAIAGSGTGPTKSSDGQPLDGNPIFAVPELDSGNYGKYPIGEQGWAALPSGTRLDYQPHTVESQTL